MSRVRGGVFRLGPVMLLALIAVLGAWPREVRADGGCKADGARCANNMSCYGHNCMKPAPPPGKAKPLFGTSCTPRACGAQDCGMVSDGCGGMLDCAPCPTTTTTSTTTTTTNSLPQCNPALLLASCANGEPANFGNCDNGLPEIDCAQARSSCIAYCSFRGGSDTCATVPCVDCRTGVQCQ